MRVSAPPAVACALLLFSSSQASVYGQTKSEPGKQDEALAAVREYALHYAKGLPDYTCIRVFDERNPGAISGNHQFAVRQELDGFSGGPVEFEEQLTVTGQRESYKVLKVVAPFWTDRLKRKVVESNWGDSLDALPVSEFGSALEGIFDPATETRFQWVRFGKLRGRRVTEFSFEVSHAHGTRIYDGAVQHDVVVGYRGLIFADAESKAVLRVEMHSSDFPNDPESVKLAAFAGVDLTLDYKPESLGGREHFLPLRYHLQWHIYMPRDLDKETYRTAAPSILATTAEYRGFSVRSAFATSENSPPKETVHSTITFGAIGSSEKK